jgi:hypothetical protein
LTSRLGCEEEIHIVMILRNSHCEYLIAENDPNLVIIGNAQYDFAPYSLCLYGQVYVSGSLQHCKRAARSYSDATRLKWVRDDQEGIRRIAGFAQHGFRPCR